MGETRTLEDRAYSAKVRDWATANGLVTSGRGRMAATVYAAYEAATGETGPAPGDDDGGDDGPDWDAAGAPATADPLADLGEPGAAGGAAAGDPGEGGPPPPADLTEARARLGGKARRPKWAGKDKPAKPARPAPPKVTRQVAGDIEGKLALLLAGPVAFWQMADPICGGAAADSLDNLVRKAVPLIIQSPAAVEWFTKGTTFLLWLDLVLAGKPIAEAVYAHHVAASVMLLPDGRAVAATRLPDGRIVPATWQDTRPQPRPDQSAYTTQVGGHVPPVPATAP